MWVFLLLAIAYAQSSFLETIAPLVKAPLILKEVALGKTVLGKSLAVYILTSIDAVTQNTISPQCENCRAGKQSYSIVTCTPGSLTHSNSCKLSLKI